MKYIIVMIFLALFTPSLYADNLYGAKVLNVVDGDTMDMLIELPLGILLKERVRVLDYDAPETWRPKSEEERVAGNKATEKAKRLLNNKNTKVSIHGRGNFGRVLVKIKLEDGRDFAEAMTK